MHIDQWFHCVIGVGILLTFPPFFPTYFKIRSIDNPTYNKEFNYSLRSMQGNCVFTNIVITLLELCQFFLLTFPHFVVYALLPLSNFSYDVDICQPILLARPILLELQLFNSLFKLFCNISTNDISSSSIGTTYEAAYFLRCLKGEVVWIKHL